MFDYLVEDNDLREEFLRYGLVERDICFIKEQIAGLQESEALSQIQVQKEREGDTRCKGGLRKLNTYWISSPATEFF